MKVWSRGSNSIPNYTLTHLVLCRRDGFHSVTEWESVLISVHLARLFITLGLFSEEKVIPFFLNQDYGLTSPHFGQSFGSLRKVLEEGLI